MTSAERRHLVRAEGRHLVRACRRSSTGQGPGGGRGSGDGARPTGTAAAALGPVGAIAASKSAVFLEAPPSSGSAATGSESSDADEAPSPWDRDPSDGIYRSGLDGFMTGGRELAHHLLHEDFHG